MSEQVPPPPPGTPPEPSPERPSGPDAGSGTGPDASAGSDPGSGSGSGAKGSGTGSGSKGWAMAAVGFCVVILGVLIAGVVSRDDSGKSSNTSPPLSVGVTQTTTTVEGKTVTQTAPSSTVTGEVTVTGSTPTTTRTTPTTPTTTRTTTGASGASTTTSSP